MKLRTKIIAPLPLLVLAMAVIAAPNAQADLIGTIPTPPGTTVFPGLVPSGAPAGTLLASLTEPWSFTTTAGTTDGTLTTAVFMESGGTLDFYYQVSNNANSATSIDRESNTNFAGFTTSTGFRVDGSLLTGGSFVDGTQAPVTADRDSTGSVVGFTFSPPTTAELTPGTTSNVLVISTNAKNFVAGNAELLDGGSVTVAAFQPAVPEPSLLIGMAMGLIAMVGVRRLRART